MVLPQVLCSTNPKVNRASVAAREGRESKYQRVWEGALSKEPVTFHWQFTSYYSHTNTDRPCNPNPTTCPPPPYPQCKCNTLFAYLCMYILITKLVTDQRGPIHTEMSPKLYTYINPKYDLKNFSAFNNKKPTQAHRNSCYFCVCVSHSPWTRQQ